MATRWWYDIIAEEEDVRINRLVQMTDVQWKQEVTKTMRSCRGDLTACMAMLDRMDAERTAAKVAPVAAPARSARDVNFGAWRDMVDEPEKYGSDLEAEWLALDTQLCASVGRWRLEGHWLQKEADLEEAATNAQQTWRDAFAQVARLAAEKGEREWFRRDIKRLVLRRRNALLLIQAVVRGHLVRSRVNFRDCCMCLAHRISPLKTDVGMMCCECAEQGPHEDITGPVADPWNWFRADFTDGRKRQRMACKTCESAPATDCVLGVWYCQGCVDETQSCRECGDTFLTGTGPGMGFCDRDCARAGW